MLVKTPAFFAAALLVGCAAPKTATRPPAFPPHIAFAAANGRLIFLTGVDSDGKQTSAQRPPLRRSCGACHGTNGAGGLHLPGGAVSADLRHAALVTQQKPPYSLALLERAISAGVDNHGKPLNPVMPHWRLSPRDLHDVAQYVLTQLK